MASCAGRSARLSRFLVRYVPSDDFVHRFASVTNPFFAHHEIDDGDTASRRHALHFFARHVAHEPGGHAVEPRGRLVGPAEAGPDLTRRGATPHGGPQL